MQGQEQNGRAEPLFYTSSKVTWAPQWFHTSFTSTLHKLSTFSLSSLLNKHIVAFLGSHCTRGLNSHILLRVLIVSSCKELSKEK